MKSKKNIFVSILLLLAIFTLTSSPVFAVDVKDNEALYVESGESLSTSTNITDIVPLDINMLSRSGCMISKYVDAKDFNEASHIERLTKEEDLDTYVFLNSDGSKSIYYMDENVKYIDKNGDVQEKDISLVNTTNGYGITRNEFDLNIPTTASSGIRMTYGGYDVRIIPQTTEKAFPAKIENGSVVYDGFFGTNTSLKYTPMLSGVKEDVIMKAYVPNASFSFILDTDGLELYNKDGKYYLAENESSKAVLNLGKVIIYDAIGKPVYGTMTVTTVTKGQKYKLSLSAPEEFLTDPATVYPVTIDPTLTVSDTVSGDGAIEDTILFSGKPSNNYGDYKYLSIGYVDSTYGVGRVAVKLPGLYNSAQYTNIDSSCITSVKFYCRDSSGNAAQQVNLYRLTGSAWDEDTVTANSSMSYNTTPNLGTTMSSSTWTAFDITALAKAWKTVFGVVANRGFILINSNETSSSCKKAPYSSEYSNSSYSPYVVMTYTTDGVDFANARTLTLDTTNSVEINTSGQKRYFKFSPSADGFYTFESSSNSGDPYARLYNANQEQIATNDNSAGNSNFRLTYHLVAEKTYYFGAGCYGSGTGVYNVELYSGGTASSISTNTLNFNNTYIAISNLACKPTYYKFTPTATNEYLFYSTKTSGDPKVWIYDSNLNRINVNDDGAGNSEFRLLLSLTSGKTYYIVAGHYGLSTGSYTLNIFENYIDNGSYYIKNRGTTRCLDVHGPGAQEWVHQWSFHYGKQCQWKLEKQADGYYTIRSEYGNKYYVGISTTTTGENNIKLYSSISDNTKWRVFQNSTGIILFEPKSATGKLLYAPNNNEDTEMQLSTLGASVSNRNKWQLAYVSAFLTCRAPSKTFTLVSQGNMANDSTWFPLIRESVNAWNSSSIATNITLSANATSTYTIEVGSYIDTYFGVTSHPDDMSTATIMINSRTIVNNANHRKSTITHEIGHILGLKDNPPVADNSSLMNHARDRNTVFIPQLFDCNNLKVTYN